MRRFKIKPQWICHLSIETSPEIPGELRANDTKPFLDFRHTGKMELRYNDPIYRFFKRSEGRLLFMEMLANVPVTFEITECVVNISPGELMLMSLRFRSVPSKFLPKAPRIMSLSVMEMETYHLKLRKKEGRKTLAKKRKKR